MRILFLTAEPPWPLDQGDKLRNYHLLRALAKVHEIILVTLFDPEKEGKEEWEKALSPLCRQIYGVPLTRGEMYVNAFRLPHLPVTMAARASFRVRNFLQKVVRKEQFDLVYACQLKTAIFIGQFPSCKRVVDFTDTVSLLYRRMLRFQPFFSRMYGFIEVQRLAFWERKIARLADLVLLVSPVDALALAKMAPEARISVIPNGVDTSYFQPLPCCERPVLTFWGNLRYVPNVDGVRWFCQEILPEIRKVIPDVELMIIGKDPSQEVIALSACPGVQVVGPVPDLRPYLAQTAVAVIPLRFGTGVRNKILEAFASARAVVSTSVGCEGLEVEPGVHLEVADEPEIFARKVIGLLQNPERRNQLAFSARILVEKNYTWEAVGERLREVVGRGKETRPW